MTKNIHKNSATKFEFDSFKICDRSLISKMIIRYRLSSLSVNASSASSVNLVIIWGNLQERVLKTWTAILLSCEKFIFFSFNSNLGGLFRGSFWGEVGKITPPSLKLVRIVLETWNLVRKYTHISSFRKYTF